MKLCSSTFSGNVWLLALTIHTWSGVKYVVTVRNIVVARQCFYTCLSFCPQGGRGRLSPRQTPLGSHPLERHSPWVDTPLGRHPPGRHPPGQTPPTPKWRPLQRTVRILLECIVVLTLILIKGRTNFLDSKDFVKFLVINKDKFESSIEFRLSCSISLHGISYMVFCFIFIGSFDYRSELTEKKKIPTPFLALFSQKNGWKSLFKETLNC